MHCDISSSLATASPNMKCHQLTCAFVCAAASAVAADPPIGPAWHTLARVPVGPIHEHSTVALPGGRLATIGGVLQSARVIDTVAIYHVANNSWTSAAPLPITINHANAADVDGVLYVLGGMTGANWAGTGQSWWYDEAANKWVALPSMPASETLRGSAAVGVYNGTVWLASGKTRSGGDSVTAVSAFDTRAKKWRTDVPAAARNIPEGRDHGGGAVVGSKFYQIAGSLKEIANRKDTVFVLDLEDLAAGWKTAKGRMPTPRRGFATGTVGTKIYTFGGEGNPDPARKGVFDSVEVYDTETDSWSKLAPMRIPRHGSYAAELGGAIYIPGGGTESGTPCTDAFDAYTP